MRRWIVRVVLALFGLFLVIQLVPYGRDHDNPAVEVDAPWQSDDGRALAVAACYDCHSNETTWPWYSNVAPVSWLVQRDVEEGRDVLNLSEWPSGETDELAESVDEGEMPPRQYLFTHPEARLSDTEKATLIAALRDLERDGDRDRRRRSDDN